MSVIDPRREAITTVLRAHDGMQRMVLEDGLPPDAIDIVDGFLVALESQGFTVAALPVDADPAPHRNGLAEWWWDQFIAKYEAGAFSVPVTEPDPTPE